MKIDPDTELNRARAEAYRQLAGAVEVESLNVHGLDFDIALIFEIDGKRKRVRMRWSGWLHEGESYSDGLKRELLAMKPHAEHLIELYGAD